MVKRAFDARHARAADHHPLGGERIGDDLPAVVDGADHVLRRHPHVVVELRAEGLAVERHARPDGDAGRVQIDHQHADAGVLLRLRIGPHRKPHVVRLVAAGRPQLLAVDDPVVAVADRAGAERGEVGTGLRLAVAEREEALAAADGGQPFVLLRLGAVQKQRLRDDRLAGAVGVAGRAGVRHLGDEGDLLAGAAALAAEFLRPADADPAVAAHQLGELPVPAALLEGLAQMRRAASPASSAWPASRAPPCGRRWRRDPCREREGRSCAPARARNRQARRGRAARRRSARDRHARAGNAAAPRAPRHSRWRRAPGASRSTPSRSAGPANASAEAANTRQSGLSLSRASAAASSVSRAPSRLIRQLASLCWTAWNWPMSWPNCFRTLA